MTSAALGISTKLSADIAAKSAVRSALEGLAPARPDAALVFATDAWGSGLQDVIAAVSDQLPIPISGGGSVEAIWTAGQGTSRNPAVAVVLLAGVAVESVLLDGIPGEEAQTGEELIDYLGGVATDPDLFFVLMDSESLLPEPLLSGLAPGLGAAQLLGLGLSALPGGTCLAWREREIRSGAVLAMRLRVRASIRAASVCRQLGPPLTITRARGNWILGLDGRPAYEVYRERVSELHLGDPALAMQHLFVLLASGLTKNANKIANSESGIAMRLRKLVGVDPKRGAISIPESVASGGTLQFAVQDEVGARENLVAMLDSCGDGQPAFGIFTASSVRQRSPFGGIEREARIVSKRFLNVPILGLHGAFQLAGIQAGPRCEVLTHAGLLTLIEP